MADLSFASVLVLVLLPVCLLLSTCCCVWCTRRCFRPENTPGPLIMPDKYGQRRYETGPAATFPTVRKTVEDKRLARIEDPDGESRLYYP
jgi:hypothetical protein